MTFEPLSVVSPNTPSQLSLVPTVIQPATSDSQVTSGDMALITSYKKRAYPTALRIARTHHEIAAC